MFRTNRHFGLSPFMKLSRLPYLKRGTRKEGFIVLHQQYWVFLICCFVLLVVGTCVLPASRAVAQTRNDDWSTPFKISASTGFLSGPRLLVAPNGHLHAFWIENKSNDPSRTGGFPEAIIHTYTDGIRWTRPHDILVASSAQGINGFSIAVDASYRLHMILVDSANGGMYYSTAELSEADLAGGWSRIQRIGPQRVLSAGIWFSRQTLYVTYTQGERPFDATLIKSKDHGTTWSKPVRISDTAEWAEAAQGSALAFGSDGALHVAWAQYRLPNGYPPERILYSRSADNGDTWSPPLQLQQGEYAAPTMISGPDDRIYLEYNGASGTRGRYFLYSSDGGRSWSKRATIAPGIGGLTGGTLALDSAGILHFATASGEVNGVDGIVYSQWNGTRWTQLVNVSRTLAPYVSEERRQGFEPSLLVTQGNQLNLVYLGEGHTTVYYVTASTNSTKVLEPTPASIGTSVPTLSLTASPSPQASSTGTRIPFLASNDLAAEPLMVNPLAVAVVPVLLLVTTIVVLRLVGHSPH